ncbi:MAG: AAA family ATPase [Bryobacteraceae bacterium]|jgi:ABC-type sulfate/molybdate transport systems ATPase subunit
MPLLRLIAEGVGPFEHLDIDLSDGKGNPHLGPHIFAGVNGSGKSTVLRTLAWVLDTGDMGFPQDDWSHLTAGYAQSRALVVIQPQTAAAGALVYACSKGAGAGHEAELAIWAKSALSNRGFDMRQFGDFDVGPPHAAHSHAPHGATRIFSRDKGTPYSGGVRLNGAAYSPSRALRHVAAVDLTKKLGSAQENSFAFESTVQNEFVQSWLLGLYSKRAIARERRQSGDQYTRSLDRFENALRLLYGQSVSFDVEIEPSFQPRLKAFGRNLDFSQLPDGVRSTVGWIADFMMRQDLVQWSATLGDKRPGVLLLDEVDAHLHPLWQRKLLPAMREALPDVQILVTSHSPFVISSCPNARVHVLELDESGRAHTRPPADSPIGESVTTTLKEIFGVDSRFDVLTEKQLDEWNTLKKREARDSLPAADKSRLQELTTTLAARSEELRSIVASPLTIPESVLRSLTAGETKPHQVKRKKRA